MIDHRSHICKHLKQDGKLKPEEKKKSGRNGIGTHERCDGKL